LSLVKAVVEAHGGEVRLESEVGVGSTFEVRLPRAPRPAG
jgi:two-component system OmpR family sensor kinase